MTTPSAKPEMTASEEMTSEQIILEERKAIIAVMKCPGKTHSLIKNPELRQAYALELNGLRLQSVQGKWRKELSTGEMWLGIRAGLESAFWSMQKQENRAFVYDGRRVTWHLSEQEDHRTPEEKQRYEEFIEKIKVTRLKMLKIKQQILTDNQTGKITDIQKSRFLRDLSDREEAKFEQLRVKYGQQLKKQRE